jgi:hypothetical protein
MIGLAMTMSIKLSPDIILASVAGRRRVEVP